MIGPRGAILFGAAFCTLALASACASKMTLPPNGGALELIAQDIERLRQSYPQLANFSAEKNIDQTAVAISYAYHAAEAVPTGGWTAGVPNPDDDGLWFHINFHSASSPAEIDTQPMLVEPQCLGDMRVGFLIREGTRSRSVNAALWHILRAHGVQECRLTTRLRPNGETV